MSPVLNPAGRPIAVVSAMAEELRALLPLVEGVQRRVVGARSFHIGTLGGTPVVLVLAGIGKVAAATTGALLIEAFDAASIVFTGVAGGIGHGVRVGDVVLARELIQHDMDASPLFPRYEVPLTGRALFPSDAALSDALGDAARHVLAYAQQVIGADHCAAFGLAAPRLHEGLVASGDRFVATAAESAALRNALPAILAVEMEGAALAQVCADFGVPFAVLRTVSDRADDSAHVDFVRFIAEVASVYTRAIVARWLGISA